jgi:predicted nucleic acid-binding protein
MERGVAIVLDASTLINLVNGEVFAVVLQIPNTTFLISDAVKKETKSIASAVDEAVGSTLVKIIDDNLIPASRFADAKKAMNLGDGETECILAAEILSLSIACDDNAARTSATARLGRHRVTGSIGLLRNAVVNNLISCAQAYQAYELMKQRGGYLPNLRQDEFCS